MVVPAYAVEALFEIAKIQEGDGAWVRRSRGSRDANNNVEGDDGDFVWTYAILKKRGEINLEFVVNERGGTKEFPPCAWARFVRAVATPALCDEGHGAAVRLAPESNGPDAGGGVLNKSAGRRLSRSRFPTEDSMLEEETGMQLDSARKNNPGELRPPNGLAFELSKSPPPMQTTSISDGPEKDTIKPYYESELSNSTYTIKTSNGSNL